MRFFVFRISLYWISTILLSIKTYLISKSVFDLGIDSITAEMILWLSSIGSIMLILALSLFVNRKFYVLTLLTIYLFVSVILYVNVLYYRFFNDFITIPVLFQTKHLTNLGGSLFDLFNLIDLLFLLDLLFLFVISKRLNLRSHTITQKKLGIILIGVTLLLVNIGLAHKERPELLTRSFDRKLLVKNIGLYAYHLYDFYLYTNTKTKIVLADNDQLTEIINHVKANDENSNPEYFGAAKGKNIIMIALESTQSFIINNEIDGEEITPFLNDLIQSRGTYYFSNFYHQTGQGKTSDAEFIIENSMYGLPRGAVFFSNPENQYHSLASVLKSEGHYYSAVFHANNKSFWNRNIMYNALGYDRFFSEEDYEIKKEDSVGWGLKDKAFFSQTIPYLKELKKPYYAKLLTLTNHFPFALEKADEIIPEWTSKDGTVNRYFTTVRYQDEALKQFFDEMKREGIYENSIFILYGDHYGISENHNKAMAQFLDKEITPYETIQLQRVPFIIHFPGRSETREITSAVGQVDVKPTVLNLMGINQEQAIQFGTDLFSTDKREFVILRDGSFITDRYIMTGNKCYMRDTGMKTSKESCEPYIQLAKEELNYSDQIIYGDLLRFLP
ncbi:LTA synthase family protein [Litchfieldia salsa]|uniref:Phosphoglycerol transferase MdoB n=1 Tax=Litchfieldia salsa TaxID=930152 RepID=A0A1H0X235_9BACI|nr:LTA synthase family protein [Litchfieldia salsa]SDP96930.1 Phosphoglycerol transferase MdoB [Litchfieldia salsa]